MPLLSILPALAYMLLFWQASRWLAYGCPQCLNRAYSVDSSILYAKTPHLFQRLFFRFSLGKNAQKHAVASHSPVPGGTCASARGFHGAMGCTAHVSLCFALLAVPAGSLPALWAWPYAGGALLGMLLCIAAVVQPCPQCDTLGHGGGAWLAAKPLLLAGAGLVLAWGVLGVCSWHRGLPGYFWHLDAFVAHPLWFEISLPGKVSLGMALVGLCSLLPRCPRLGKAKSAYGTAAWHEPGPQGQEQPLPVAYVAWLVLWHAVVVSLFLSCNLGPWFEGNWWIVIDFFLFWAKVSILLFLFSPCCVRWLGPWGGGGLLVVGLGGVLVWGLA